MNMKRVTITVDEKTAEILDKEKRRFLKSPGFWNQSGYIQQAIQFFYEHTEEKQ
jgi:hypothetical protein